MGCLESKDAYATEDPVLPNPENPMTVEIKASAKESDSTVSTMVTATPVMSTKAPGKETSATGSLDAPTTVGSSTSSLATSDLENDRKNRNQDSSSNAGDMGDRKSTKDSGRDSQKGAGKKDRKSKKGDGKAAEAGEEQQQNRTSTSYSSFTPDAENRQSKKGKGKRDSKGKGKRNSKNDWNGWNW